MCLHHITLVRQPLEDTEILFSGGQIKSFKLVSRQLFLYLHCITVYSYHSVKSVVHQKLLRMSIDFHRPFFNDFPRVNYLKSKWGAAPACSTPASSRTPGIIRYPPPMMTRLRLRSPPPAPSCSTTGGFGPTWVYHCYIFLRHLCLNSEIVMSIFRSTFTERFIQLISKVSGTFYRANGLLILDLVIEPA